MIDDRTPEIQTLYQQAFRDFGSVALWNMRPVNQPTPADALAITITMAPRTHGRMNGRRPAEADGWFNGPPYAVAESVFDEDDLPACSLEPDDDIEATP